MRFCATIGHSNHTIDDFIKILLSHHINTVIDVRSAPYSRRHPQFNRESLKTDLNLHDIRYLYLGDRLGGRHTDPQLLFPNGRVNFKKVRETAWFQEAITRVVAEIDRGFTVVLLCAEKDPLRCHRFLLICPALVRLGVTVVHITGEGKQMSQEEVEERLLKTCGLDKRQFGLFEPVKTREELLEEAYDLTIRGR